MSGDAFGIYVHVPYCRSRCPYCDFNSVAIADPPWPRYTAALTAEVKARASAFAGLTVASVYLGGGTPSLAPADTIGRVLAAVREQFAVGAAPEITLEANPGTLDPTHLASLRQLGCNRLSLGLQSTSDRLLAVLGRAHTAAQGLESVREARRAGFENVSVDLIFAVPGQSLADLEADLEKVLALEAEHVSIYALTYHAGTDFEARRRAGRLTPVDEDLESDMMDRIDLLLTHAGLEHYEVSNYARPGRRAVHNTLYWTGAKYLGVGAGAHSFTHKEWRHGWRWEGRRDPEAYVAAWEAVSNRGLPPPKGPTTEAVETLSQEQLARERILCGLRYVDGIDLREPAFAGMLTWIEPALAAAKRRYWITRDGSRVRPTPVGMRFGDALAALFF
ncbi:MAG: radical SAM family heme chaperone HemW [Deltaproteobacteria bacterium]|nr:radical SAM family heme chaperone HemW [Deltaproteobacteria bacterium]